MGEANRYARNRHIDRFAAWHDVRRFLVRLARGHIYVKQVYLIGIKTNR